MNSTVGLVERIYEARDARDVRSRKTIRHSENWLRLFDFLLFATWVPMIAAGILYFIADTVSLKELLLLIIGIGLVVLLVILIVEHALDVVIRNARGDLNDAGEEGFNSRVNRLIDRREWKNKVKNRLDQ